MELTQSQLTKADATLARALGSASPHDVLRVILILPSPHHVTPPPHPADFANREAFRQASIEWNASGSSSGLLDRLRALDLNPLGGELGAVVVHGTAEHLLRAIDQPEVLHAILDATISITPPRRPSSATG